MSGIVLQGKALKVVNKGGGRKCRTENIGGGMLRIHTGPKEKGTDYIIFNCPVCGKRNKQSAYDSIGASGESISFKCKMCRREIEVAKPRSIPVILDPNSPATSKSGLVGPDGRPIG